MDDFDRDKIDEVVLALMQLTLHDGYRAWKGFDWDVLNRLHEKGLIDDPRNKAKSVVLTEEGLAESARLLEKHFGVAKKA
jgi:DNA-binding PadR family transcriptional regulator